MFFVIACGDDSSSASDAWSENQSSSAWIASSSSNSRNDMSGSSSSSWTLSSSDSRVTEATGSSPEDNVFEPGIRPMEPLQPSSKTKKTSRYSKRSENAELSETIGATPKSHSREQLPNIEDLERQMKEAAARLDFEEAARIRDIIRGIK